MRDPLYPIKTSFELGVRESLMSWTREFLLAEVRVCHFFWLYISFCTNISKDIVSPCAKV